MEVVEWCLISCETGMFSESKQIWEFGEREILSRSLRAKKI